MRIIPAEVLEQFSIASQSSSCCCSLALTELHSSLPYFIPHVPPCSLLLSLLLLQIFALSSSTLLPSAHFPRDRASWGEGWGEVCSVMR